MSEAILWVIDAPAVQSADDAAAYVEEFGDNTNAPTSRIATCFVRVLFTWPKDGSKGHVFHEDFNNNKPYGTLLQLVVELSGFDAERLQHLRAIAKHHGVHLFDPEGHVLYLSDGSEAGVPAMSPPAAGAPTQCTSGVRFDGVYETRMEQSWSYLCFTAEGKILWQSIGGRFAAKSVMATFIKGDAFVVKGKYKPDEKSFTASLKASFGSFRMNGTLEDDGLHVHSERVNGKYPYDAIYAFLPLNP